jgi:biopolymer transport protein ExbD
VLKRPSARRKGSREQIELNLVPMLDTMVTLIAFLLFTMSFLSIVGIETPFPTASPESVQKKLLEKPLQLTISIREKDTEIWSPFEKIRSKTIPNPTEGTPDMRLVHEALLEVKKQFPNENQIVVAPAPGISYDVLIATLDAIRQVEPTDPPIFAKNTQTGLDEVVKKLFPNIVFGNLLGSS